MELEPCLSSYEICYMYEYVYDIFRSCLVFLQFLRKTNHTENKLLMVARRERILHVKGKETFLRRENIDKIIKAFLSCVHNARKFYTRK
jgi:hypothetical protein